MREKKEKRSLGAAAFVLPAGFHIEAEGSESVLVEGCTGIQLYEPERIRIGAGRQCVQITGSDLAISSMFGRTLCVCGRIVSIEFV